MEEYRNKVNAQHAPQELIQRTIEYIHETDQITDKASLSVTHKKLHKQKVLKRIVTAAAMAACFGVCLILCMKTFGQPRISYTMVSDVVFRDRLSEPYTEEWSLQEYESYLGTELITLPEECEPVTSKIYVGCDEEGKSILADEGTFYLEAHGCVVILKVSKSGLEVPEELLAGPGSDINGTTVYVGENVLNKQFLAVFWQEEVEYYLICNDMSKRQFEKLLNQMF